MIVGIADVATNLILVLFRRRQELSTPGTPFGVHGLDVSNPDIEEGADPVGIARSLQGDGRLVVVGPPPPLMMMKVLASPMYVTSSPSSPEKTILPPSTSV